MSKKLNETQEKAYSLVLYEGDTIKINCEKEIKNYLVVDGRLRETN